MDQSIDDLVSHYVASGGNAQDFLADWRASFNIAPTTQIPIIREHSAEGRRVDAAIWDLRPPWRKESRHPMINARLETVTEKPMWRTAFTQRRALIPMTGYFEWTGPKGSRQPHFISAGGPLLSAAGLYEIRKGADSQSPWEISCAIITRQAQDASGEVHDRMPVFLTSEVWDEWLSPEPVAPADSHDLVHLLHEVSSQVAGELHTYQVSPRVNSVRGDTSDRGLIARLNGE